MRCMELFTEGRSAQIRDLNQCPTFEIYLGSTDQQDLLDAIECCEQGGSVRSKFSEDALLEGDSPRDDFDVGLPAEWGKRQDHFPAVLLVPAAPEPASIRQGPHRPADLGLVHGGVSSDSLRTELLELTERGENPPLRDRQIVMGAIDGSELLRDRGADPVEPIGQKFLKFEFVHPLIVTKWTVTDATSFGGSTP